MAARSMAWIVFALAKAGIVVSYPTQGMDVCVCVVLCLDSGIATGWSLVQGVLLSVKNDYGTEEEARAQQGAVETLMNEWMNE
jgi:hypothetical protein